MFRIFNFRVWSSGAHRNHWIDEESIGLTWLLITM